LDGGHEENELQGNRSCAPVKTVNEAYIVRGNPALPDQEAELRTSTRLKGKPRSRNDDFLWTSDSAMK
jgi:hypothetical protein